MSLGMYPRRNWDSPTPTLASVFTPQRGGGPLPAGEGLGESQFRRLEIKLSTLPTLWGHPKVAQTAAEQTHPEAAQTTAQAGLEQTCPRGSTSCCRRDMSRGSLGYCRTSRGSKGYCRTDTSRDQRWASTLAYKLNARHRSNNQP